MVRSRLAAGEQPSGECGESRAISESGGCGSRLRFMPGRTRVRGGEPASVHGRPRQNRTAIDFPRRIRERPSCRHSSRAAEPAEGLYPELTRFRGSPPCPARRAARLPTNCDQLVGLRAWRGTLKSSARIFTRSSIFGIGGELLRAGMLPPCSGLRARIFRSVHSVLSRHGNGRRSVRPASRRSSGSGTPGRRTCTRTSAPAGNRAGPAAPRSRVARHPRAAPGSCRAAGARTSAISSEAQGCLDREAPVGSPVPSNGSLTVNLEPARLPGSRR